MARTVLVTGGNRGIGLAIAQAFAKQGDRVAVTHRGSGAPEGLYGVQCDITDPAQVDAAFTQIEKDLGPVEVLVANAGITDDTLLLRMSEEQFERVIDTNLKGSFRVAKRASSKMLRAKWGRIIFISSVVGLRALPYLGGYAAAKAALDRLVESLRMELRGSGVAVTLVRPGTTSTSFAQSRLGAGHERRRMRTRAATPEQVAQVILGAARREPRVAYVSLADRLRVLFGLLAPELADAMLARAFEWEEGDT